MSWIRYENKILKNENKIDFKFFFGNYEKINIHSR